MIRLTLENLLARRFRLVSTALSVLIGVAFLAGTLVLTDTLGATFDDLFDDVTAGTDVEIRSSEEIDTGFGPIRGRIDDELLAEVLALPDVAAAASGVGGFAQLVDPEGVPMGNPGQGAPTLGFTWTDIEELNPTNLIDGRSPTGPGEVVIDAQSAKDGPFAVGDMVTILLQGPPQEFEIVGVVTFGRADSPLGASLAIFELTTGQELMAEPGMVDVIDVVAAEGVSQEALSDQIADLLPDGVEAITGEKLAEENKNAVGEALSFFNTFMITFAAVALFVASFIIYNTFSILVVQRTREMALLRALGARRHQVLGTVLLEAMVVGIVASVLGLVAGLGVASLLKGLLAAIGLAIPTGPVVFAARTVWLSLLVGIGVTVVAALIPSRRASTVAPMAAIREVEVDESGRSVVRIGAGAGLLALGLALLLWGLLGDPSNALAVIGGGVVFVFLAVAAFGPIAALPFSRVVGLPVARFRGVPGELARENAMRNPKRTSTTAAALMIGVGLVASISIFAESAKASINDIIDDAFVGDLVVDSGAFGFGGLSPDLATRLNDLPEVAAASGVRVGFAEIGGEAQTLFGGDPATIGSIVDVGVTAGRIEDLGPSDIAVHEEFAAIQGWQLGDAVDVTFAQTGVQSLTVSVLYAKDELTGNFFIGNPAFEANYPDIFDFQVYVLRSPDASPEQARAAVEAVAADFANAEVQDLQQYKQAQYDQVNQLLGLIYALLGLAIIIALIGIANTLALSILERTHELGLLRAVGMTRRQLRAAVRWESVLIALLGTNLGAGVGLFFGWSMVRALRDDGFTQLRIPVSQLLIVAAVAVAAGVLAATQPARRAAKLDILRAISTE